MHRLADAAKCIGMDADGGEMGAQPSKEDEKSDRLGDNGNIRLQDRGGTAKNMDTKENILGRGSGDGKDGENTKQKQSVELIGNNGDGKQGNKNHNTGNQVER